MQLTFIWGRRDWSFGKALCVVTRYIPFVHIPVTLSSALGHHDVDTCHALFYAITIINAVAITISELIFFLRMYAMWNRSRLIFIIICCTLAASLGTLMFIFFRFLSSVTFGVPPLPIVSGCYMTGASTVLFASFVDIICAEAVTTSLMLYGAYRHFRHARNLLVQNLMHDGVFYCLSMFVMSVLNVLVIFLLPLQYSQVLVMGDAYYPRDAECSFTSANSTVPYTA
ncbi:hypothetical protein BU15DRAFT_80927 [Melanogaster broomeanus]|nr:hypothetical protein BU15DRAFT_80927 [Melanogaster broomeanus]